MRWWFVSMIIVLLLVSCAPPQKSVEQKVFPWPPAQEQQESEPVVGQKVKKVLGNEDDIHQQWSAGRCEGSKKVLLTMSPIDPQNLELILPMGLMADGHVTPVDHQYWTPKGAGSDSNNEQEPQYPIYAPADGYIVSIQHMKEYIGDDKANGGKVDDYRIILEHSCRSYTYFIHVSTLAPEIMKAVLWSDEKLLYGARIKVKAGDVIGLQRKKPFDFAVIDTNVTLRGFLVPEHYVREPWKIHTVDPFEYFVEPVKSQVMAKVVRTILPRGGKIDYDMDGKLVGNWFEQGRNGYAGNNLERYWDSHAAFAYDYIDPLQLRVSLGNFAGKAAQFGVKGNTPDPKTIGVGEQVKYELVNYDYYVGDKIWDRWLFAPNIKAKNNDQNVRGIVLVEVTGQRLLKMEVFPGQTAEEINGFTGKEKTYER